MAVLPAAGGCVGLSIPMGGSPANNPATTGSIGAAWSVPRHLPDGLAASDAAAMAEAARQALAAGGNAVDSWQNPATGSSGTLVALHALEQEGRESCRTYLSTVTSLRGVHRYACRACRTGDGQVAIRSIEAAATETASAGI